MEQSSSQQANTKLELAAPLFITFYGMHENKQSANKHLKMN
jgi:hypothetical protein